mmetsp:Transcript_34928/g.116717  ORF Transcript_34928/g.116717 Transcript_34928/m.116717 type:complete len:200 (+) Transcript_34928:1022-1621(+)
MRLWPHPAGAVVRAAARRRLSLWAGAHTAVGLLFPLPRFAQPLPARRDGPRGRVRQLGYRSLRRPPSQLAGRLHTARHIPLRCALPLRHDARRPHDGRRPPLGGAAAAAPRRAPRRGGEVVGAARAARERRHHWRAAAVEASPPRRAVRRGRRGRRGGVLAPCTHLVLQEWAGEPEDSEYCREQRWHAWWSGARDTASR